MCYGGGVWSKSQYPLLSHSAVVLVCGPVVELYSCGPVLETYHSQSSAGSHTAIMECVRWILLLLLPLALAHKVTVLDL